MSTIQQPQQMPAMLFGYEVVEYLGTGAASQLYAVSHPQTSQLYAMKYVVRRTEKDDRFIDQLETELTVGRHVIHRGLRRSIELLFNRTMLRKVQDAALLLELFDGRPIDVHPPTGGIPGILDCFIQVADALGAMHAAGYVHCDLKPNNILIDQSAGVKVIDLGQACKIGTIKQRVQGTPDYMAPEQVKSLPMTVRTDVFNFGATLYWALCGKSVPTLYTLKRAKNSFLLDTQLAAPAAINPDVPQPLSQFVMECCRSNPEKRPADMVEIQRRLELLHFHLTREKHARASLLPDGGLGFAPNQLGVV
ncbi:MAG TPA: serine/threonine-protein kinase [Tepidisphaeraceae bacterium]|jgi:serine/threonine-protein kinase|nr:serine/threonine-protein kinase [Tepidisphaeraceae bacterium]